MHLCKLIGQEHELAKNMLRPIGAKILFFRRLVARCVGARGSRKVLCRWKVLGPRLQTDGAQGRAAVAKERRYSNNIFSIYNNVLERYVQDACGRRSRLGVGPELTLHTHSQTHTQVGGPLLEPLRSEY